MLNTKSIKDKYSALKEEKDGKTMSLVPVKYGIPTNLDQVMFKWLLIVWSRNVAVSALVFKTKVIEFAEKMNVEHFKASDSWKKRFNVSFKTVSGECNACTDEMVYVFLLTVR